MFRCPDCTKSGEKSSNLRITARIRTSIHVAPDESVEESESKDLEWNDTDQADCLNCGWDGTVAEMTVTEPEEGHTKEEVCH